MTYLHCNFNITAKTSQGRNGVVSGKIMSEKPTSKYNFRNQSFWILFYTALVSFTLFLIVILTKTFLDNPTLTTLESSVHPVTEVPYPGIAFCNINKISKRRAQELANYIINTTGDDFATTMESIRLLGQLYDFDYDRSKKSQIDGFQQVLDWIGLSIPEVMRMLTTPCEELLRTCHWKGIKVDCSTIFYLRLTFEGYCCAFNYVKNTSEWRMRRDTEIEPEHGEPGLNNGLSVVVNNDHEDYYYTMMQSIGVNVHVFISSDYPDKASGDLIECLGAIRSENFVEIIPTTVTAIKDVMDYPVYKRKCLFEVEQLTQFGVYSQSDCFVDCRVRSLLTLCECIPFPIPTSDEHTVCTLRDLPCLNRYKGKWMSLTPDDIVDIKMKEQEDALSCPQTCYPSCAATLYAVSTTTAPILSTSRQQNITSVHIYYRNKFHNLYKQDVVYHWFEMLSNYGGIFGLIVGISLVSVMQGVVYIIKLVVAKI